MIPVWSTCSNVYLFAYIRRYIRRFSNIYVSFHINTSLFTYIRLFAHSYVSFHIYTPHFEYIRLFPRTIASFHIHSSRFTYIRFFPYIHRAEHVLSTCVLQKFMLTCILEAQKCFPHMFKRSLFSWTGPIFSLYACISLLSLPVSWRNWCSCSRGVVDHFAHIFIGLFSHT